jgi:hypothetical protein
MQGSTFYFSTIRKYVTLFGSLFNDINIVRTNAEGKTTQLIKVPITYGPKDKMIARVSEDPNIDRPTAIQLPVMSFEMTTITYDASRKLNTIGRIASGSSAAGSLKYQYNPVAYNIGFVLHVYVKNAEDGTKIVEQILPYFTPDWTVTANLIPEMNVKMDIPVILNDISLDDSYDGDFKERRALIWTLNFTLKGYVYGPVKSAKIIKFANTEFYIGTTENIMDSVNVTAASVDIQVIPGLTANGQPTSNSNNSIPVSEITATDNYGYITNITENING